MLRLTVLKGDVTRPLGERPEEEGLDLPIPEDATLFNFRCHPAMSVKGDDPNLVTWRWIATYTQRVAA